MDLFSIRTVVLDSGERFSLLVESSPLGVPHATVTRYVLAALRPRGLKASTLRTRVGALGRGLEFCQARGIDLDARIAKVDFLVYEELTGLADLCRRRRDGDGVITPQYAKVRFQTFVNFVLWSSGPIIARINDDQRRTQAHAARELFIKQAEALAPRDDGPGAEPPYERLGMTPEQRDLFLKVITPGSDLNPFIPALQYRNYVMLKTVYDYGLRAGELLGLKTRHIDFSKRPATITIMRSHHDKEDPRQEQPVQKTSGRELELSCEMRDILDEWIMKHRADRTKFPKARTHPFLFVNKFGDPLSLRGLRKLLEDLRRRYPVFEGLCAHIFRHDWNDRWEDKRAEEGWDFAEATRDQCYAMGWKMNSTMPERYSRRAIRKLANAKVLKLQERAVKGDD